MTGSWLAVAPLIRARLIGADGVVAPAAEAGCWARSKSDGGDGVAAAAAGGVKCSGNDAPNALAGDVAPDDIGRPIICASTPIVGLKLLIASAGD